MEKGKALQIQSYLEGLKYPARKKEIIDRATRNEPPAYLVKALQSLDEGDVFESPMEISRALEKVEV